MANPVDAHGQPRGEAAADLTPEEEQKAVDQESPGAGVTHEAIRLEGDKELERASSALAWSGLAGGLSMGLSFLAEAVLRSHLPDAPWRPLVAKLGYPIGFLVAILGSQQLYTENTLTPIVPFMANRTATMARKVLALWSVVLLANLVGGLLFAWAAAYSEVFTPELRATMEELAREAVAPTFGALFARAVASGWIIALMVWMIPAADTGKIAVIAVMTWLVGVAELSHVIVGSIEALYLAARGGISYAAFATDYLVPVLLGNTIGGVVLVAGVNHAQVRSGARAAPGA
ncbi:MAG: formate/nitrite transporter family protein [Gemmatirosa sp.]